jgi:hypothetical protein
MVWFTRELPILFSISPRNCFGEALRNTFLYWPIPISSGRAWPASELFESGLISLCLTQPRFNLFNSCFSDLFDKCLMPCFLQLWHILALSGIMSVSSLSSTCRKRLQQIQTSTARHAIFSCAKVFNLQTILRTSKLFSLGKLSIC